MNYSHQLSANHPWRSLHSGEEVTVWYQGKIIKCKVVAIDVSSDAGRLDVLLSPYTDIGTGKLDVSDFKTWENYELLIPYHGQYWIWWESNHLDPTDRIKSLAEILNEM